ncbi:MAG: ABC transporter ATP-binding protein [Candidatus Scalindua sp.]|nr:ABC transporter ATP-binding protein [Candidatus Scalindua sp.]
MFWISVFLLSFVALWECVIFASMSSFFQTLIDTTKYSEGKFPSGFPVGYVYKILVQIPEDKRVLVAFVFAAGSMLVSNLINMGATIYHSRFSTLFTCQNQSVIFNSMCRNSLKYFEDKKRGELMQMVITETTSCYSVLTGVLVLTLFLFKTIVYIVFLVMVSFKLSLIVAVFGMLFIAETYIVSRMIKWIATVEVEMNRKLSVVTHESLDGVKHIKLLNLYRQAESSFRNCCRKAKFSTRRIFLLAQWQVTLSHLLALIAIFVIAYVSIRYSVLAVALLMTYLYILQKFHQSIRGINNRYTFISKNLPAIGRIFDFLHDVDTYKEISGSIIQDEFLKEEITSKNVSLNYGNENVLENIVTGFCKGQTVALVGESGAGKTSLANLLVRLYDSSRGEILIDGINIKDYDLAFLRERIGIVNQESIIFNRTIRENILMGNQNASEEDMIEAAKNAYAHKFIMETSHGYDTLVGDNGLKLSGGQKQRINIAQIFLKSPDLMILDEATSALDTKSEQYIQVALEKLAKNRTCIIIAHRLSTVRKADTIIVLDKGRIAEQGRWSYLLEKKGLFYSMIQRQSFINE